MKTILLIFLLIPIATFIGIIFADIISNMKRVNNMQKTNVRKIRGDYQQNERNYYKKGKMKQGKVIKMKYRAIK